MTVKLLTEHHLEFLCLKGGCTGSSESTLVKMPHSWKSHVTAHTFLFFSENSFSSIYSLEPLSYHYFWCMMMMECFLLCRSAAYIQMHSVNTMNPNQTAPKEIVWSLGYKTFFMLRSTEHKISTAHKN